MRNTLTVKQQHILDVIEANPGIQNDEMKLLEAVWLAEGWDQSKSLSFNLIRVTHPETISRCRRLLHEKEYITYSEKSDKKRYKTYIEMTNEYGERVMVNL